MTSFTYFFIFLAFSASAYNNTGIQIMDLFESIDSDISSWASKNPLSTGIYKCQGYKRLSEYGSYSLRSSSLSRTYTSLLSHNYIYITFSLWIIDDWDLDIDIVTLNIDGKFISTFSLTSGSGNKCEDSYFYGDVGEIRIAMILAHSASSIQVNLKSSTYYANAYTSFGLSKISIIALNSTNITLNSIYANGSIIPSSAKSFSSYPNILSKTTCDISCLECFGSGPTDCLSCKIGYYYNGTRCIIQKCPINFYYSWNNSCIANCSSPLISKYQNGLLTCLYSCNQTEYLYWDGTCKNTCESPLNITRYLERNFCNYPCSSSQYLFSNKTCGKTCVKPYYIKAIQERFLCLTCLSNEYLLSNQTCSTGCPSTYYQYNISTYRMCELDCGTNYLYYNETCLPSCSSPSISLNSSGKLSCLFPCDMGSGLYWYSNKTCGICDPPLQRNYQYGGQYCSFPCDPNSASPFYHFNGSCISSCPSHLSSVNITIGIYCNSPCQPDEFLYKNGSCQSACDSRMLNFLQDGIQLCYPPCNTSEFLYYNGSCLTSCALPYIQTDEIFGKACNFPCNSSSPVLAWNNSCIIDCDFPLKIVSQYQAFFCENPCYLQPNTFLYFNQSCLPTCDPPFVRGNLTNQSCEFPCNISNQEYLLYNGTCNTICESNLPVVNTTEGLFCNFKCNPQTQFLFWNDSCLERCPLPLIQRNISDRRFCDPPCGGGLIYFSNGSCNSSCNAPFIPIDMDYGKKCEFPCKNSFLFENGSCQSYCYDKWIPKKFYEFDLCLAPCGNEEYITPNYTCIKSCPFPLTKNLESLSCDSPCKKSEYFDNKTLTCKSECEFPFKQESTYGVYSCYEPCNLNSLVADQEKCISAFTSDLLNSQNLTYQQLQQISETTSNFLDSKTFASACSDSSSYSKDIINSTLKIINQVSSLLQSLSLKNPNLTSLSTKNFDVYGLVQNDCLLNKNPIVTSNLAPEISLLYKNGQCTNSTVNITYFVLNSSLYTCGSTQTKDKDKIFLAVVNSSDGNSVIEKLSATIKMAVCPIGCTTRSLVCICENLDIFDVKNQILSLFANSNIGKISNFDALANWDFYGDPVFWIIVAIYIWLFLTTILVKKVLKDNCCVKTYLERRKKAFYLTLFKAMHPLINIYCYDSPFISKGLRAVTYAFRIMSMLTFASIFKTTKNDTIGSMINPYVILLPYVTFVPIVAILEAVISKPPARKEEDTRKISKMRIIIGISLFIIIILGFTLIIFVLAANQTSDEKVPWIIQFSKIMTQDSIISPVIFVLQALVIHKLSNSKKCIKCFKKMTKSLIDPGILEMLNSRINRGSRLNRIIKRPPKSLLMLKENNEFSTISQLV